MEGCIAEAKGRGQRTTFGTKDDLQAHSISKINCTSRTGESVAWNKVDSSQAPRKIQAANYAMHFAKVYEAATTEGQGKCGGAGERGRQNMLEGRDGGYNYL